MKYFFSFITSVGWLAAVFLISYIVVWLIELVGGYGFLIFGGIGIFILAWLMIHAILYG